MLLGLSMITAVTDPHIKLGVAKAKACFVEVCFAENYRVTPVLCGMVIIIPPVLESGQNLDMKVISVRRAEGGIRKLGRIAYARKFKLLKACGSSGSKCHLEQESGSRGGLRATLQARGNGADA